MKPSAIVTIPPYAPFIKDVLAHPIVSGVRLNTVMPTKEPLAELLKRLNGVADHYGGKDVWVDLKCRQLRVEGYWTPPFTELKVSHSLTLDTTSPVDAYFSDGQEHTKIVAVDGNRILTLDGPKRVVGPGESINIIHPSLSIDGYLTDTDKRYLEAGEKVGVKNYMLSFVEEPEDITKALKLFPGANIVAKIESLKGMNYVNNVWKGEARLMAARGDLYVEVKRPHKVVEAVEDIVRKDKHAIVASRLFGSLANSYEPSCADIGDVDNLLRMGYQSFMLGDDVCMKKESVMSALNLFEYMAERYTW